MNNQNTLDHQSGSAILLSILLFVLMMTLAPSRALADQEASNRAYVTSSKYGHFYARSLPSESYGTKGKTEIYAVNKDGDKLLHTYPWFAPKIYLEGFLGSNSFYVVQKGPWARGRRASAKHLAIALYKGPQLLKRYSSTDIFKVTGKLSNSVSHYRVFKKITGFQRPFGNQLVFEVMGFNNQTLMFNADTGAMITPDEITLHKQLYEARGQIGRLKWKWYDANEKLGKQRDKIKITEAMLKQVAPYDFPQLPKGYQYIPDSMWASVRLEKK